MRNTLNATRGILTADGESGSMNFQRGRRAEHEHGRQYQQRLLSRPERGADGEGSDAGGDAQADFSVKPETPQPHAADRIVDFVDYL